MIDIDSFSQDFKNRYGVLPAIFSAPGRVNLIGEHTDYNDGFVLPFAIDKRTYVGVASRSDGLINVHSRTLDESVEITLSDPERTQGWSLYIRGIAEVLKREGVFRGGADLLIDSEIPFGAGLSSSAALEISVGLALSTIGGKDIGMVELAFVGQEVEHEYIGVRSGIMDQFTSALALSGHALLIDCRSLEFENIPLDLGGYVLVVCDSKVEHELADTEYNRRREECEEGVELLRQRFPDIHALRDVTDDQLRESHDLLPANVFRRCRHVINENIRTLESAGAIATGDLNRLGILMYESHESLRVDYEVSCAELDWLVDAASKFDGVIGGRMTGGGFGGCTINLVKNDAADGFRAQIEEEFRDRFDKDTDVFRVSPSAGAHGHSVDSRNINSV